MIRTLLHFIKEEEEVFKFSGKEEEERSELILNLRGLNFAILPS